MDVFMFIFVMTWVVGTYAGPEYDFEIEKIGPYNFEAKNSNRSINPLYYKNGRKSLLWRWSDKAKGSFPAKLTIFLRKSVQIKGKELKEGGIKFWMYREKELPTSTMHMVLQGGGTKTSPTSINLNFKGWRSVWIGYEEFGSEMSKLKKLTKVNFIITSSPGDTLYFDLIRFVTSMKGQTRDVIVKKVGQLARTSAPQFYNENDFWQQSLRWHETSVPRAAKSTSSMKSKINEIRSIEKRLQNWYVNYDDVLSISNIVDNTVIEINMNPIKVIHFPNMKKNRWLSLKKDIEAAHDYYNKIRFNENRPPLFVEMAEFGEEDITDDQNGMTKFGFIFTRILLPLSLEYNLLGRQAEVRELAKRLCKEMESPNFEKRLKAIVIVAGNNHEMITEFRQILEKYLKLNSLDCVLNNGRMKKAEDVIYKFNEEVRFKRIVRLLKFLENQGWAEGSGLGSLDQEIYKVGSGFMHSIFLLRRGLRKPKYQEILGRLIKTMKWYNDFNEIYQPDITTADRMSTILLYRLMTILINDNEAEKIRDMKHFKTWFKHSLKINKGLGGIIKPDFTSFHHNTFYGAAYVPQALHNAALVQCLLEGTAYALDKDAKKNLRKSLAVFRTVAVKYSTPNSIGGRFPGYDKAILAEHFPAYAYISYFHVKGAPAMGVEKPAMFLRLFDPKEPSVKAYLEDGHIKSGIHYWNTIGSLDVLQKVVTLKCINKCTAETYLTGHWSKNFAALSIHRRKDWCVTVKGFNRYTWDYESSPLENKYGVFASHGSLQISNSESSLKAYDVNEGWDWTRVPGATTVKSQLVNIVSNKARHYNAGNFAGGLSFIGSFGKEPRNGAFAMVFKNPPYSFKNKNSPLIKMEFEFKKSFFFYNDLIICLGSDIKFKGVNANNYYAQTTLFQDKLVDPFKSSKIMIDSKRQDLRVLLKTQTKWGATVKLKDTNGNTYQIKKAGASGLNVKISDQNSKTTDGGKMTKARYAIAWLVHKKENSQNTDQQTKRDSKNDVYVNGVNIEAKEKVDSGLKYADGVGDGSNQYLINEDKREKYIDTPDHGEIHDTKNIDPHNFTQESNNNQDNDVSDDSDDDNYYDREPGMDGLGTEINYDEGSTCGHDANLVHQHNSDTQRDTGINTNRTMSNEAKSSFIEVNDAKVNNQNENQTSRNTRHTGTNVMDEDLVNQPMPSNTNSYNVKKDKKLTTEQITKNNFQMERENAKETRLHSNKQVKKNKGMVKLTQILNGSIPSSMNNKDKAKTTELRKKRKTMHTMLTKFMKNKRKKDEYLPRSTNDKTKETKPHNRKELQSNRKEYDVLESIKVSMDADAVVSSVDDIGKETTVENSKSAKKEGNYKSEMSNDKMKGVKMHHRKEMRTNDKAKVNSSMQPHAIVSIDLDAGMDNGTVNDSSNSAKKEDYNADAMKERTKETKVHPRKLVWMNETVDDPMKSNTKVNIDSGADINNETIEFDTINNDLAVGGNSYEYAILVKNGNPLLLSSYKVLQQSSQCHAVELSGLPDLIPPVNKVYAYSIFDKVGATISTGPVISVDASCMMMAEFGPATLNLAISNPVIEFQDDPKVKGKERCTRKGRKDIKDKFSPKNSEEVGSNMMYCVEGKKSSDINVQLRIDIPKDKLIIQIVNVMVDGKPAASTYARLDPADITKVIFSNLVNGFTTEISVIFFPRPQ